ncbi:hypothetical protein COY62_02650 [bacterium (Candidatus Howlettbacteria) CG_4_10_14_0_8_um_filter_40_9]|nr:MAG: hypothetical protein COY62_02650 [bacterium (Candidatus Howlettbacteria) CG_4_10_14_0_8_um_filter_40_9]
MTTFSFDHNSKGLVNLETSSYVGLNSELIKELQGILREECNLELDLEKTTEVARLLMDCYSLLLDPEKEGKP